MMIQKLLIDWPLTPYTGWGSYGIQLAQALAASGLARPVLTSKADRSPQCQLPWLRKLEELEGFSAALIEHSTANPSALVETNCRVVMEPMGNAVPHMRFRGRHQVGVTFFERTSLDERYRADLERFDLVITGSQWNQELLEQTGFKRSVLIHQGVDDCHFHPRAVPRLMGGDFVVFAGGKLEARKGQDIVIAAFKKLLKVCPSALLIACWGNIGSVGLGTISQSRHVEGHPANGEAGSIYEWLIKQGIPAKNILVPTVTANSQLPALMKQADVAVFCSRCEGGTNLMAMEALACGVPTVLSNNTGHKDLIEMGCLHAIAVGHNGLGQVPSEITAGYGGDPAGLWGETNPDELVDQWLRIKTDKQAWQDKGQAGARIMSSMTWARCMKTLTDCLIERDLLEPTC